MSWSTSTADLRTLLSDGPTDRHRFRKRVFGETNGTNTLFKTFEFRRVTNFTTASLPLGVFKNGTILSNVAISADYPSTGEFSFVTAPVDGDFIEASYFIQWFTDAELNDFLSTATNWLNLGSDPSALPSGLIPPALKYAAAEAYQKMAIRWKEYLSDTYRLDDAPDPKSGGMTDEFIKLAENFGKQAQDLAVNYYTRSSQNKQPLFGQVLGSVPDVTPRR